MSSLFFYYKSMEVIQNIFKFLERTELRWNEVPAFNECIQYLLTLEKNGDNERREDSINKSYEEDEEASTGWNIDR